MTAKALLKRGLRSLGYSITRVSAEAGARGDREELRYEPAEGARHDWLKKLGIGTILDVGAHEGYAALRLHAIFPSATIYSFEPLPDCHRKLELALASLPGRHRSFRVALGEKRERVTLNRSIFSPSSSVLEMAELHRAAYPFSAEHTIESIEVETLDDMTASLQLAPQVLLKVDVQGAERNVILGASRTLSEVHVAIIEVSFAELYVAQPLFRDIYELMRDRGFEYRGAWAQSRDPRDGRILQQDAIFIRPS